MRGREGIIIKSAREGGHFHDYTFCLKCIYVILGKQIFYFHKLITERILVNCFSSGYPGDRSVSVVGIQVTGLFQ